MKPTAAGRRAWLRGALALPAAALAAAAAGRAQAAEYASPAEVLAAIEARSAAARALLAVLAGRVPGARAFAASCERDHARCARERRVLRRRLGPPDSAVPAASAAAATLAALREAQQELVFAHAEGLPALGDARAVDLLARHLVEFARQLAVVDLWLEAEEERA